MHGNKVLHRDLKTQNVFMLGNGRLVLGDLGISKVLDGTMDFAQTCIGTPYCKFFLLFLLEIFLFFLYNMWVYSVYIFHMGVIQFLIFLL